MLGSQQWRHSLPSFPSSGSHCSRLPLPPDWFCSQLEKCNFPFKKSLFTWIKELSFQFSTSFPLFFFLSYSPISHVTFIRKNNEKQWQKVSHSKHIHLTELKSRFCNKGFGYKHFIRRVVTESMVREEKWGKTAKSGTSLLCRLLCENWGSQHCGPPERLQNTSEIVPRKGKKVGPFTHLYLPIIGWSLLSGH